jgi:hypothetical protein
MVLDLDDVYDSDPWRWRDVQSDALGMIANGLHDETIDTPEGVFVSSQRYPLSQFALDDKHQADAAKLAELQGTTVDELELRLIATRWSRPASCTPRTPRSMAG